MATTALAPYHALRKSVGFTQARNFNLFLLLGGALTLFSGTWLTRLLLHGGDYSAAIPVRDSPSITHVVAHSPRRRVALNLHLLTVLPAALLAVLQFVPIIRRRALGVHRWSGRLSMLLSVPGIASTVFLLDRAHGGDMSVRSSVSVLAVAAAGALARGWWLVRQKRVMEHRAWMLRGWAYMACIITMRPTMIILGMAISQPALSRQLYAPLACRELDFYFAHAPPNASLSAAENVRALYPACAHGADVTLVPAALTPANMRAQRLDLAQAALNLNFGTGVWLALALHAVLVEWYLRADAQAAKPKKA